ncbi:glycosyltransferase family 2 protein [Candidatus Entotheonella palauensis]|uniref:glycosyltransferase family 2 protein n=1 Tax=Candidatus Entotheonella palauensis TaxID=93172 RepID=UPI0015C497EF|nr:glycosyltransferase family 2 protein [Candidatus Entotheonella palauensis]
MFDKGHPELSIIVPCYNEEAVLPEFMKRMDAACRACVGSNFEILLVNDGSRDQTLDIIRTFSAANANVVGVDLFRQHGHQLAVTAGMQLCRGRRVMIIDADLQDPPELLPDFMAKMDEGYDVVYGQRRSRKGETWFKKMTASLFYRGLKLLTETDIPLDTGDFRLITRQIVDYMQDMPESHRFLRGMVAWIGGRQTALVYDREARFAGTTHYTPRKVAALALEAVTSFSAAPLRLSMLMAFVATTIAMVLLVYVFISYFYYDSVPGWASLGTIVLFFSAVQLFCLGIMGEYIGRIYFEGKQRPITMIREVISQNTMNQENRQDV